MSGPSLTWVSRTPNVKTGDIPTAYVGATLSEARQTCRGCPLLDNGCYAWVGMTRLSMGRIEDRRANGPERYSLETALRNRAKTATAARIGALGDPGRADRAELLDAVARLRREGLAVLAYTHFWGEPGAAELRGVCMASCEDANDAVEARRRGFVPAVLLPWDHVEEVGKTFRLGDGSKGVVCPAQTRDAVTCNSCRMCDVRHPVWGRLDFPIGPLSAYALEVRQATCHPERRYRARGLCGPCYSKMIREKYPEVFAARDRQKALRKFGLTDDDYEDILEAQVGRCAICRTFPEKARLCVDHDYANGEIRGLLCHDCNKALGMIADSSEALARTVRYLQAPPTGFLSRPQESTAEIGSDPVRRHLWSAHGLTLEEFEELARRQNGVCAICRSTCETGSRLSVDHDHESKRVRGLLCRRCNRFVGLLKDDPDRALSALAYLCDPQHEVWKAGRVSAIGFLDHSPGARGARRRQGRQLDLIPHATDKRPLSRTSRGLAPGA